MRPDPKTIWQTYNKSGRIYNSVLSIDCVINQPFLALSLRTRQPSHISTNTEKKAVEWEAPPDYLRAAATMGEPEEDFPGERLAMEASFNEVFPAPDDVADE